MANENAVINEEIKPKFNSWIVSIPIIGAAFMFVLDETIANVALLHMAGSYSASREEALWILTSYLIASGIVIPAVDWFCKLMGRKTFFMFSILLFVCSSFLCGISNTLSMMIFSRIMQGLGGGALLPQFLQSLMGYNAYLSGLSMMPRGAGSLTSVILSGLLSNKIDNRILICIGLICVGIAGFQLSEVNLDISMTSISVPNFILGLGMGFSFVPSIALSAVTLKNNQMTNASGLQSLLRNIGGAIGTSLSGTMIARCSQMHQYYMVDKLNELNPVYMDRLSETAAGLSLYAHPAEAQYMAQSILYKQLVQQSTLLGFTDTFRMFSIAAMIIIPTVFLLKNIDCKKQERKN